MRVIIEHLNGETFTEFGKSVETIIRREFGPGSTVDKNLAIRDGDDMPVGHIVPIGGVTDPGVMVRNEDGSKVGITTSGLNYNGSVGVQWIGGNYPVLAFPETLVRHLVKSAISY